MQLCFVALGKGAGGSWLALRRGAAPFWLTFVSLVVGCQTATREDLKQSASTSLTSKDQFDHPAENKAGYFVAVSADVAHQDFRAFYDQLYRVVDTYNRSQRRDKKSLKVYLAEQRESGYTALTVHNDEIECDRQKCLIKLSNRVISGSDSLAQALGQTISQLKKSDSPNQKISAPSPGKKISDRLVQPLIVGNRDSIHIVCDVIGSGVQAGYRCQFNLDQALADGSAPTATIGDVGRGKLSSCDLAPGTVRDAEEAKEQLDDGGLLPLTLAPSLDAKVVGYFRYGQVAGKFEFFDIYLCGDLSQDHFQMQGEARRPRIWTEQRPLQISALDRSALSNLGLSLQTRSLATTANDVLVEVQFRLVDQTDEAASVAGADKFYMHLDKAWLH